MDRDIVKNEQAETSAHRASLRGEASSRVNCRTFVLLVLLAVILSFLLIIFGVQRRVTPPQRPHSVEHGVSRVSVFNTRRYGTGPEVTPYFGRDS